MTIRRVLISSLPLTILISVSASCGSDPAQQADNLDSGSLDEQSDDNDDPDGPSTKSFDDDDDSSDEGTVETFRIQTSVEGQGSISLDPDEEEFAEGDKVKVSAVADEGWVFSHWSDDFDEESKETVNVEVKEELSVTAHFVETFGIDLEVVGEGTIEIDPDQEYYLAGDEISLTAVPETGWKFAGFSGDVEESESPAEVTVDQNTTISAQFIELYTLAVNVEGSGTVAIDPEQEFYEPDSVVAVEAIAEDGWRFDHWTTAQGDETANPHDVILSDHVELSAVFSESVQTVFTTNVKDNLNPKDRTIFMDRLKQLGYEESGSNENVSKSELIELIARPDITALYHTGHGTKGKIMTSNKGSVGVKDVTSVDVGHLFIATCLTLVPTTWMEKMGPTSQGIYGYTKVSLDYVDNKVVNTFADKLEDQQTFLQAWYAANSSQSQLRDRWLAYWREEAEIVEYSARSDNKPQRNGAESFQSLQANVKVADSLLSDSRTFSDQFAGLNFRAYEIDPNAKLESKFFRPSGREFLAKSSMSSKQALQVAKAWSRAGLPGDVNLRDIREIRVASSGAVQSKAVLGYAVRYQKELDSLPVLTNGRAIFAELLVNDGSVAAQSVYWPAINTSEVSQRDIESGLIPVRVAINRVSASISAGLKTPINIMDVSPCYGLQGQTIVPAYAFHDESGLELIVDAQNGELLD